MDSGEELLRTLLREKNVSSSSSWEYAIKLMESDSRFESVRSLPTRRVIFNEYKQQKSKEEKENAKELRRRNREILRDILDSIPDITAQTTWAQAQTYIMQSEVFNKDMDKLDALEVFIDHIEQLEEEEKEERKRERKTKAKQERENRFAFVRYLDELHAAGHLTSISKWQNLYQIISADPRYIALLSQPLSGSTALDLFKFYVEDLKARYEDEKQIINEILKSRNFTITLETTFVDFATFVSEDERSANLDGGNLKMIFERLMEKEREKERLRLRQVMKKKRKLEHGLYTILAKYTHLDSSLDWQSVRPLICEDPAFKAIAKEEDRIEIFRSYLNAINDKCLHNHKKSVPCNRDIPRQ